MRETKFACGSFVDELLSSEPRVCPDCGCSDDDPCHVHGTPCCWIKTVGDEAVCSACVSIDELVSDRNGRGWLRVVIPRAVTELHRPFVPSRAEAEAIRRAMNGAEL